MQRGNYSMRKKSGKKEPFDNRFLLGIEEDLSTAPGELEELKILLEEFDRKQQDQDELSQKERQKRKE